MGYNATPAPSRPQMSSGPRGSESWHGICKTPLKKFCKIRQGGPMHHLLSGTKTPAEQ